MNKDKRERERERRKEVKETQVIFLRSLAASERKSERKNEWKIIPGKI